MSRALTSVASAQISNKRIKIVYVFKVGGIDYSDYLLNWDINQDKTFGASSGVFILNNDGAIFSDGGGCQISVGDVIEFSEYFGGDTTEYKRFYGIVEQRSFAKASNSRTATLNCLDYLAILQKTDINLKMEATKIEVTEETLTPNYLPSPNDSLAQVFNFTHNAVAPIPSPLLTIRPRTGNTTLVTEQHQYDGFQIQYDTGQVKLGTPLNVLYNYDLIATSYFFYSDGLYVEDIIEEIIKTEDGFGNFLYGESSAADVVTNHLTETFYNVEGKDYDTLIPNYTSSTITIKHEVTVDYDTGGGVLYLDSIEGLPDSGTGTVNGDTFTWTGISSGNGLTGVSGLLTHPSGSYMSYEATYAVGQLWYLSYSNISSTLSVGSVVGIDSASVAYRDHRNGRIILDSAISVSSNVHYNGSYSFCTLQTAGIQLNSIEFNAREIENRFEAIKKVFGYCPPNYIIRTHGDNKIWASLLTQKTNEDYTLNLVRQANFLDDEDLYTRVVFYRKNINPTNIMFNTGIDFLTTGENYLATAVQTELQYEKDEGNFYVYKTTITDAGKIDLDTLVPTVFLNGIPVDNQTHQLTGMPVTIETITRTTTETTGGKEPSVNVTQYFYYSVRLPHTGLDPSQSIYFYDANGVLKITVAPNSSNMNYSAGVYGVESGSQNTVIELLSTASYVVLYSTNSLKIDYDTVRFKVSKQLVPNRDQVNVYATFKYWTSLTPISGLRSVIDGRWDTQMQTEFFAEPPTGLNYAILDLGQIYDIQAVDVVAGFYKPDDIRKFDVDFRFTVQYSLDNVSYYNISSDCTNLHLVSGENVSLEEDQLGVGFQTRYLKVILEDVKKIEYENGVWPVAFTEFSAYNDIVLKSESKLIPTTELASGILANATTITVLSTAGFATPTSGHTETAYVGGDDFTYTDITSTQFLGVLGVGHAYATGTRVSQTIAGDTSIYDDDYILPKLGDRVYKSVSIDDGLLFDQTKLDTISKAYLREYYKNHSKIQEEILFAPYLRMGQTVLIVDTYDNINSNYFIESIRDVNGNFSCVVAKYPS